MVRPLLAASTVLACVSWGATTLAQTMPAGPVQSDPLNALWSFLGSSSVAGVLYLWAKSEQTDRREATRKMVELVEQDVEHKAVLRERLKTQDEVLATLLEQQRRLEQRLEAFAPPPRPSGRPGG